MSNFIGKFARFNAPKSSNFLGARLSQSAVPKTCKHTVPARMFTATATPDTKVAVILSGCGVFDGAEITESVAVAVRLSSKGYTPVFYAPDRDQMHVLDHTKGEELNQKRNVLVESARIARGEINNLKQLKPSDFAAVIFPGGFGAAKNLSNFATQGDKMDVIPEVKETLESFHREKKPIGLCCISPVLAAKCLPGVTLTVGSDQESEYWPHAGAAGAIQSMGANHVVTGIQDTQVDEQNRVVTSPAYMANAKPHEVFENVSSMVDDVLRFLSK